MRGALPLLRLAARRDRVAIAVWTTVLGSLSGVTYLAFDRMYTAESRAALAASVSGSRGLWALYGRPADLSTVGGLTAWREGTMLAVAVSLVSSFAVVRHTRGEEDAGRAEPLLAGSTSRTAPPVAAVLEATGLAALIGTASTAALVTLGAPLAGSAAFGLSLLLTGWVFLAAAAVLAQVVGLGRKANMLSCLLIGVAFVLRAAGDGGRSIGWLTWLSPFGWAEHVRPFAGDRWVVLLIPGLVGAVLCCLAVRLSRGRDIGEGLVGGDRDGGDRDGGARRRVGGPWGLAVRLQRGVTGAWALGALVCGAVFGSLTGAVVELLESDAESADIIRRMGGSSSVSAAYAGEMLTLVALGAAACGVQGVLRLGTEDVAGRLGWTVATGRARRTWCASHLAAALSGATVVLLAGSIGLVLGATRSASVAPAWWVVGRGALERVPAVWALVSVAFVVVAAAPRAVGLAWTGLATCVVVTVLGETLRLDDLVMGLSPFDHVPPLSGPSDVVPALVVGAVAAACAIGGTARFERRDLG